MWHKPCRTFHPWCLCIKTRCLFNTEMGLCEKAWIFNTHCSNITWPSCDLRSQETWLFGQANNKDDVKVRNTGPVDRIFTGDCCHNVLLLSNGLLQYRWLCQILASSLQLSVCLLREINFVHWWRIRLSMTELAQSPVKYENLYFVWRFIGTIVTTVLK